MEAAVRYVVVEMGTVVVAGWILFLRSVLVWQHIHPRAWWTIFSQLHYNSTQRRSPGICREREGVEVRPLSAETSVYRKALYRGPRAGKNSLDTLRWWITCEEAKRRITNWLHRFHKSRSQSEELLLYEFFVGSSNEEKLGKRQFAAIHPLSSTLSFFWENAEVLAKENSSWTNIRRNHR